MIFELGICHAGFLNTINVIFEGQDRRLYSSRSPGKNVCLERWLSNYLWPPYVIGQAIIFFPCGFSIYLSFFFPRLILAATDWISTILLHMV